MRLDRFLANAGCGSRSVVKQYISKGRIKVGESVIKTSGFILAETELQTVKLDDRPVIWSRFRYLMLHKPVGVITALHDNRHRTIADLIPIEFLSSGIVPVGRLDLDATGLLLLTSDGTLCHRLTSPRRGIWKKYAVTVSGKQFSLAEIEVFAAGIKLTDGTTCRPAILEIKDDYRSILSISEGRYHQVKRMMLAMGHKVETLHRISFGPLDLDEKIAPGEYRELSGNEVKNLYEAVSLTAPEL